METTVVNEEYAVSVDLLSKTFYTGFFAPVPYLRNYTFGRLHKVVSAVNQVSFNIRPGEIFALLGANGAGKSTTMKMLMGLIKPSSGKATLLGRDIRATKARVGVGYLPENPSFYDELTPRELMRLYCALNGVPSREQNRHSEVLIDRVGMSYAADRPLRKLSKGMHQRIGIAQALIGDPKLIVLDEPFSGLDPIGRREVRTVLLEEQARGATLLFTSHILPDVEALCDRFLILEGGKVRHQGDLSDLSLSHADIELTITQPTDTLISSLLALEGCHRQRDNLSTHEPLTSFILPNTQCEQALSLILSEHGQVYSMHRVKPQLESLFMTDDSSPESSLSCIEGKQADLEPIREEHQ